MHVPLGGLVGETVDLLRVGHRAQGRNRQRLRLPSGEKARAVRARKHPDLDGDVAHVLEAAAVDANPLYHDSLADPVLERLVEELAEDLDVLMEPLAELDDRLPPKLTHVGLARRFAPL